MYTDASPRTPQRIQHKVIRDHHIMCVCVCMYVCMYVLGMSSFRIFSRFDTLLNCFRFRLFRYDALIYP